LSIWIGLLSSVLFSVEYLAASGGLVFVFCVAFKIYSDLRQWIFFLCCVSGLP